MCEIICSFSPSLPFLFLLCFLFILFSYSSPFFLSPFCSLTPLLSFLFSYSLLLSFSSSSSLLSSPFSCSIFCIGFFAIVLAIKTSLYFQDGNSIIIETLTSSDVEAIGLFPSSIKGAITCLSYCSLTFLCQFQLFSLEKELNRPRRWKLNFIIIASMVLAYVLYNIVAFAGYLQVSDKSLSLSLSLLSLS